MSEDQGQDALFTVDQLADLPEPRRRGRVERALARAIVAGRKESILQDVDGGLVAAALVAARSLDAAEAGGRADRGYLVAQLLRPYQDALEALGLAGRGVPTGKAASEAPDWEHAFGTPEPS